MIYAKTFTSLISVDDALKQIDIPDDKIINVIDKGCERVEGYDDYDYWTRYYIEVIYKD